ncbi:MAG: 50S ribosomal protein L32 [Candidatus Colwellbacteria bacterium]|nr:50S ribosomal protein L32 [Candidatus Colwellbacteria bacterium]
MSVPKKKHSKSKAGRRRSHLAIKKTALHPCTNCKAPTLSHQVCKNCGQYKKAGSR